MKKIALLGLLLSSLYLHADTVITESIDMGGRNMMLTLKIKGDKIRMDASPQMSTVMDTASGDTLMLMHAQKSYMTISGEQAKTMREQFQKMKGAAAETPAGKPKLVDTGKSEKVGAFNTEIYTMDTPTSKLTFWATKEIPNYAALQEQLKKLQAMANQGPAGHFAPDPGDMQGFPVKTQIVSKGNTVTVTVLSAEEKPVDDAELAAPAGYTKVSMPNFGGAGPRQGQP